MSKKPEHLDISQEVTVNKAELLKAIEDNREKHRKAFELAVDGWHDTVVITLDQWKKDILAGKHASVMISLPMPEDHTKDYDSIIRRLKMHVDEVVIIPTREFDQFVQDDWAWKANWSASNANYVRMSEGKFDRSGR